MKLLIVCWLSAITLISHAQENAGEKIYISVGAAKVKKSLIAIPAFQYVGAPSSIARQRDIGIELYKTLHNDLDVSNYFTFIRHEAFLEDPSKTSLKPKPMDPEGFNFASWASIGTEFLIRSGYRVSSNEIQFEAYLYYVPRGELVLGKIYRGGTDSARKIAHTFAAEILEKLTGSKGMFLSKVVVTTDEPGNGIKEVYVMDWDGKNKRKVTNHRSLALSPSWAPDGRSIAYTAFTRRPDGKRNPDLYIYELFSGKRWLVSQRPGLNSGSVFYPDNNNLLLTISPAGGNPDIYKMDRTGKIIKRVTRGPRRAMNVEPAISRDGKKVAFSSDRSGRPNIYIGGPEGESPRLVTFAGRYNSTPTWSADGKQLAFASFQNGHFDIYILNADGTGLKRLTESKKPDGKGATSEDPTFSPDGRHIMFVSDRSGHRQLYVINPDGTNERRITFDKINYFKPKWSYDY